MLLAFSLSMPNVGSWNGQWSGAGRPYVRVHFVPAKKAESIMAQGSYYYDFGDGWSANIHVRRVGCDEAKKLRKHSAGFCGYEWMIREIFDYGRIKTLAERTAEREAGEQLKAVKALGGGGA